MNKDQGIFCHIICIIIFAARNGDVFQPERSRNVKQIARIPAVLRIGFPIDRSAALSFDDDILARGNLYLSLVRSRSFNIDRFFDNDSAWGASRLVDHILQWSVTPIGTIDMVNIVDGSLITIEAGITQHRRDRLHLLICGLNVCAVHVFIFQSFPCVSQFHIHQRHDLLAVVRVDVLRSRQALSQLQKILHVCGNRVAVLRIMLVLVQTAGQHCIIAVFPVDMSLGLFQLTDLHAFGYIALGRVGMPLNRFGFLLPADQALHRCAAGILVGVALVLLQPANQLSNGLIAAAVMDVVLSLGNAADQFRKGPPARAVMGMSPGRPGLLQRAGQLLADCKARLIMGMALRFLQAAGQLGTRSAAFTGVRMGRDSADGSFICRTGQVVSQRGGLDQAQTHRQGEEQGKSALAQGLINLHTILPFFAELFGCKVSGSRTSVERHAAL